jgi:hypothetical protein
MSSLANSIIIAYIIPIIVVIIRVNLVIDLTLLICICSSKALTVIYNPCASPVGIIRNTRHIAINIV